MCAGINKKLAKNWVLETQRWTTAGCASAQGVIAAQKSPYMCPGKVEDILPACEMRKISVRSFTFGFTPLPLTCSVPAYLGVSAALTLYCFGVP